MTTSKQILLRLRRAGLVESVRGARGGYMLAREPRAVSVKDVIEASETRDVEVNCDVHRVDEERCDRRPPAAFVPSGASSSDASTKCSPASILPICCMRSQRSIKSPGLRPKLTPLSHEELLRTPGTSRFLM